MTSCILTIIKNEHLYLDEWIKYHLDIGVDHIFIFEDIDSNSHYEITKNYHNVSLNKISDIVDDCLIKELLLNKKKSNKNPQPTYIQKGLNYITTNFNYDWCFVIDADEFITLENKQNKLDSILKLYSLYDAVILQWECYGANGLINTPNYDNKGVVDIYTKKLQGVVPIGSRTSLSKTCYNLNTYKEEYSGNVHQPTDLCNFCRTDFSKDRYAKIYDKIYLRHYITKSWEEFYNKRKNRGFLFGGPHRDLDSFFTMNSDMKNLKTILIQYPIEDSQTLVIIPYKQNKSQGNELELAITAWKKFCKFKYRLLVVGQFDEDLPRKFPGIGFLRTDELDKKEGQYNPHIDIMIKMMKAYDIFNKQYAGFIYMTDDCYAIKPFTLQDILTVHYHEKSFIGNPNKPAHFWKHNKFKTRQLLDKENLPHINYTTHFPFYFDFNKLKEICDKYNMLEESYVIEDVYFNYFEHEEPILDKPIRCGICNQKDFKENFQNAINNPETKFIFNSVEGWSKELEEKLLEIINR